MQWQDALAGWQGTLDAGNVKKWWVDEADLGKGPFRWALTQNGQSLAASEPFTLPTARGQVVKISMTVEP